MGAPFDAVKSIPTFKNKRRTKKNNIFDNKFIVIKIIQYGVIMKATSTTMNFKLII